MEYGLIKDTTLTAMADSLREKGIAPKYKKATFECFTYASNNTTSLDDPTPTMEHTSKIVYISVPEATELDLEIDVGVYNNPDTGFAYTSVNIATLKIIDAATSNQIDSAGIDRTTEHLSFRVNNNSVGIALTDAIVSAQKDWAAFTVKAYPVVNGERAAIERETDEINSITPEEMVEALNNFIATPSVEPLVLTGNCDYACTGPISGTYFELYGDTLSTKDITSASNMFYKNPMTSVPFDINISAQASGLSNMFRECVKLTSIPDMNFKTDSYADVNYLFYNCKLLENIPKVLNAYPNNMGSLFGYCHRVRNIPDDFFSTWNNSRILSYAYAGGSSIFVYCYSLRKVPSSLFEFYSDGLGTSSTYCIYSSLATSCFALDELTGLPVFSNTLTGNMFSNIVNYCYRLQRLTFKTNDDGTPKTAKWKNQTIDLTAYVGYSGGAQSLTSYNSGITADKEVKDDATYQALKNDPDWFATKVEYSRYNHDSAVETINSLPDCSATGINTIKFKKAAGANTDGGAIETLTAEEIAVAAAKGWTVTLVS